MATLQDLETAIDTFLRHPAGIRQYQLIRQVEEKAYEAYIFCLCLRAVRGLNAQITLKDVRGITNPTPFIFRGGPGKIYSTYRYYGHIEFSLAQETFEIHAGIEVNGLSMRHELDVCILKSTFASSARTMRSDPGPASVVGVWECKFYSGTLDKHLGRAFVGLIDDMSDKHRLNGFCSNSTSPQLCAYFKPKNRPDRFFRLTPLSPNEEEIFVNNIKKVIRKMTGAQ